MLETELVAGLPEMAYALQRVQETIQEGGIHLQFDSAVRPAQLLSAFAYAAEAAGWTIEAQDTVAPDAGLVATQGDLYARLGTHAADDGTILDLCVWPAAPEDDTCGEAEISS
jgi:hypothetical protein